MIFLKNVVTFITIDTFFGGCINFLRSNPALNIKIRKKLDLYAVTAEGALAPPEFGVSEKRTERERDNVLLSAPSVLKSLICIVIN